MRINSDGGCSYLCLFIFHFTPYLSARPLFWMLVEVGQQE